MRLLELCGSKYRLKNSIVKGLENPPAELADIYEGIYQELFIDGQDSLEGRVAQLILSYLLQPRFPLNRKSLMEACRIYGDDSLDEGEINGDLIQSILPGFFALVDRHFTRGIFEFAHLSVREHFENHADYTSTRSNTRVAVACLRALNGYATTYASKKASGEWPDKSEVKDGLTVALPIYSPKPSSANDVPKRRSSIIIIHGSTIEKESWRELMRSEDLSGPSSE